MNDLADFRPSGQTIDHDLGQGASFREHNGRFGPTRYGRDSNHESRRVAILRAGCRFKQRHAIHSHAAYLHNLAGDIVRGRDSLDGLDPVTREDVKAVVDGFGEDIAFRQAKDDKRADIIASLTAQSVAAD